MKVNWLWHFGMQKQSKLHKLVHNQVATSVKNPDSRHSSHANYRISIICFKLK